MGLRYASIANFQIGSCFVELSTKINSIFSKVDLLSVATGFSRPLDCEKLFVISLKNSDTNREIKLNTDSPRKCKSDSYSISQRG